MAPSMERCAGELAGALKGAMPTTECLAFGVSKGLVRRALRLRSNAATPRVPVWSPHIFSAPPPAPPNAPRARTAASSTPDPHRFLPPVPSPPGPFPSRDVTVRRHRRRRGDGEGPADPPHRLQAQRRRVAPADVPRRGARRRRRRRAPRRPGPRPRRLRRALLHPRPEPHHLSPHRLLSERFRRLRRRRKAAPAATGRGSRRRRPRRRRRRWRSSPSASLASGVFPPSALARMYEGTTAVLVAGRVPQIVANFRAKSTGELLARDAGAYVASVARARLHHRAGGRRRENRRRARPSPAGMNWVILAQMVWYGGGAGEGGARGGGGKKKRA